MRSKKDSMHQLTYETENPYKNKMYYNTYFIFKSDHYSKEKYS